MIVADANLIVYRYFDMPLTALTNASLAKDPNWRTAPLWRCEFTSAAVKMVRAKAVEEQVAITAMRAAALEMNGRQLEASQESVLRLAIALGISAYDAQYVAIAERLGVRCVTGDAQLARKAPSHCIMLSDFAI